jgi:hypothetical protein
MDNPLVNALVGSGAVAFFGSCVFAVWRVATGRPLRPSLLPSRMLVTIEVATPITITPATPAAVGVDLDPPPPNNQTKQ